MSTTAVRLTSGDADGLTVQAPVPVIGGPPDGLIWVAVVDEEVHAVGAAPRGAMQRADGLIRYRRTSETVDGKRVYVHDPGPLG
jgi:hypothetical protein